MKRRLASAAGGAIATAAIPAGMGVLNPKVLAGCAALGAVGGLCGINVAAWARRYMARRKAPPA